MLPLDCAAVPKRGRFALAMDAANRGDTETLAALRYPDIDAGVDGVRWVERCVESANNDSTWIAY